MYTAIPAWLALAFVAIGLYALAWSADRFVEGAEAVVGTAGAISPFKDVSPYVFTRDLPVMLLLSLSQSDCSDAISGVCGLMAPWPVPAESSGWPRLSSI